MMKSPKKIHQNVLCIALLITMLLSCVSCQGEYHYAMTGEGDTTTFDPNEYVPPVMNDDPTDDFIVTIKADGEEYRPRTQMFVQWSDGFSIHRAQVDDHGVARIDGLDGDYHVTLSGVPNEYVYDPNSHMATNDERSIIVGLHTVNRLTGLGTDLYDGCYQFSKLGVYSVELESADDVLYFQYAPQGSGTYTIESWADTNADNINPYIKVYGGSSEYKYYLKDINDGGPEGSYTINFIHTVQMADEHIGATGQAVYTFALMADAKNGKYPITVTFAVKRNGGFELDYDGRETEMAVPTFDFSTFAPEAHIYGSDYTLTYPEYQSTEGTKTVYAFDESRFKLWKKELGGDGFYHLYDEERYADASTNNPGYGPILYANIATPTRFIDTAFTLIEYEAGSNPLKIINKALTISGINYKHFIEGYEFLSTYGNIADIGSYYCVNGCPCHTTADKTNWACPPSCTKCLSSCRRCPEELIGKKGYGDIASIEGLGGRVPVTEELREFLYDYAVKQQFFYDGIGSLEKSSPAYRSLGKSDWLFACCYYLKNE